MELIVLFKLSFVAVKDISCVSLSLPRLLWLPKSLISPLVLSYFEPELAPSIFF